MKKFPLVHLTSTKWNGGGETHNGLGKGSGGGGGVRKLKITEKPVLSNLSPVITCSGDKTLKVYESKSGMCKRTFNAGIEAGPVNCFVVSHFKCYCILILR